MKRKRRNEAKRLSVYNALYSGSAVHTAKRVNRLNRIATNRNAQSSAQQFENSNG